MPGDEVCFLLEDVFELGGLGGVLDLADAAALRRVGDVLGLAFADIAGGLVGADRVVEQGEGAADPAGQDQRRQEAGEHHAAGPFADPQHGMPGGV